MFTTKQLILANKIWYSGPSPNSLFVDKSEYHIIIYVRLESDSFISIPIKICPIN